MNRRGRPIGKGKPFAPVPLHGLRAARIAAGETLEQAGALIGVNKSHMGKFETGATRLDVARALVLARHYRIPIESFIDYSARRF
jgi:transcriptional regulator with XRE-family HTH domain